MDTDKKDSRLGVVVCKHVLEGKARPVYVAVDDPIDTFDSGWQVLCHKGHYESDMRIISFESLLKLDASIAGISDLLPGDSATRVEHLANWEVNRAL